MTLKTHYAIGTALNPITVLGAFGCIFPDIASIWLLCYFSHLILDSITVSGVPFLYGYKKTRYGLKLFVTGGLFDKLLLCLGTFFKYM